MFGRVVPIQWWCSGGIGIVCLCQMHVKGFLQVFAKLMGMRHMCFVSSMRVLSSLIMSGIDKGATLKAYSIPGRMIVFLNLVF